MTRKMEDVLEKLKKKYSVLENKYSLPSFKEMNEDFDIEKIQDKETEMLLREVRRAMLEKNLGYLKFAEMFLNPSQAPMFFIMLVKNIDSDYRKNLNDLYAELGKYEILSVSLDNIYNEKKEADFIKTFFAKWQNIKKQFADLMSSLEQGWDKQSERKEKGYLG